MKLPRYQYLGSDVNCVPAIKDDSLLLLAVLGLFQQSADVATPPYNRLCLLALRLLPLCLLQVTVIVVHVWQFCFCSRM